MCSNQRSEGFHAFMDRFINRKTSLLEFVKQIDKALCRRRVDELEKDKQTREAILERRTTATMPDLSARENGCGSVISTEVGADLAEGLATLRADFVTVLRDYDERLREVVRGGVSKMWEHCRDEAFRAGQASAETSWMERASRMEAEGDRARNRLLQAESDAAQARRDCTAARAEAAAGRAEAEKAIAEKQAAEGALTEVRKEAAEARASAEAARNEALRATELQAYAESQVYVHKSRVADLEAEVVGCRQRAEAAEAASLEASVKAERAADEARTVSGQWAEAERGLRRSVQTKEEEVQALLKQKEVDEAKSNIESFNAAVSEVQEAFPDLDLSPFYINLSSLPDAPVEGSAPVVRSP